VVEVNRGRACLDQSRPESVARHRVHGETGRPEAPTSTSGTALSLTVNDSAQTEPVTPEVGDHVGDPRQADAKPRGRLRPSKILSCTTPRETTSG